MKISRRKFIGAGGVAAAVALANIASGQSRSLGRFVGPLPLTGDPLSRLTWDSFYPYVTTYFSFTDAAGTTVSLRLIDMTDTKPVGFKPQTKYEECFTLIFAGSSRQPLSQTTYSVEHFALGNFELFITGGRGITKSSRYVAVINRITG